MIAETFFKDNDEISILDQLEINRRKISSSLDPKDRSFLGQYLTQQRIAEFMASLFNNITDEISLLDPGAGLGTLTAAFIVEASRNTHTPSNIHAELFEIDPKMIDGLNLTIQSCANFLENRQLNISGNINETDFIEWGVENILAQNSFFSKNFVEFTHCIMNPPYSKIRNDSKYRKLLRQIGIETGNLYSAFLAISIHLLASGGELVAIVPRSFCNGPYFKPFRDILIKNMSLRHLHVFDSRKDAFKDDDVLQENIILHAIKNAPQENVIITSSSGPEFDFLTQREVSFDKVVKPNDPDKFIHIAVSDFEQMIIDRISVFSSTLSATGIEVSTGPVVDFRLKEDISQQFKENTYPLIYPGHFSKNNVDWPKPAGKKPNAIKESGNSSQYLMPSGHYVLTKRFSSKEEKRRIVAALFQPESVPGEKVGFENHLNVFHTKKQGLEPEIAKGLALYLNSTLIDRYFRQFSGHTQVNATDLKTLHYPTRETLLRLGQQINGDFPTQEDVDKILDREIDKMTEQNSKNPLIIEKRVAEALSILIAIGLPKGQQNERSALTLLALIDLKPDDDWQKASSPLIGITPIMDYIREYYGVGYAPNTRETIRRQTMHQFVDAGVAISNPDRPDRAINSPKWCYQISPEALGLIRSYNTDLWKKELTSYIEKQQSLAERYAKAREMQMIPLKIDGETEITLTPGEHSQLIKEIITEFGPRFAPDANVLYVGDTGSKMGFFDSKTFEDLGLAFDNHGKFPDVVLYLESKNWLLLIEAVTSHGPVDSKRHIELETLFSGGNAGIVYVTAFPNRQSMGKYLSEISWETDVWVADAPTHLIHFDGERFLGPYKGKSS